MILGIDTATSLCSVALWDGERFTQWEEKTPTGHAGLLMPMIERAFREAAGRVDTFVVSRGPGSFTGIRIGVATALGLQLAGNLKVFAVSALKARSYLDGFEGIRVPLIDARRERVYGACYGAASHEEVNAPFEHFIEFLSGKTEPIAFLGEGLETFHRQARERLQRDITLAQARHTAQGAIRAFLEGEYSEEIAPVYLREVEAVRRKEMGDAYTGD